MRRTLSATALVAATLLSLVAGLGLSLTEESGSPEKPGPVEQPTEIPGKWEIVDLPLPPMEKIAALPAQDVPVYGVYLWCGEYRQFREEIKQVGWKAIRLGGPMDDQTMRMICEDGLEIMKTLQIGGQPNLDVERNKRDDYESDEAFLADAMRTVEAFLGRYGPGGAFFKENPDVPVHPITHIEVWNEPNFQYMIPPREGVDRPTVEAEREALYAKLLPLVYKTVKARWPKVTVVGFGAGGSSAGDLRFIEHVHNLSPKVARSYDILSTHPYTQPAPPDARALRSWGGYSVASSLETVRKTLAAHGRSDAPIWYTEIGWVISRAEGGRFPPKGGTTPLTQALQAAYVCRLYALSQRLNVDRVHIMFITDSDGFNGGFFRREDNAWRQSAWAARSMIHLMPHPKLVAAPIDGEDGTFAYEFVADARKRSIAPHVVMAWNVAGPKTIELPCKAPSATVVDMLGHRKTVEAAGGKVKVDIGPCPVYVIAK